MSMKSYRCYLTIDIPANTFKEVSKKLSEVIARNTSVENVVNVKIDEFPQQIKCAEKIGIVKVPIKNLNRIKFEKESKNGQADKNDD